MMLETCDRRLMMPNPAQKKKLAGILNHLNTHNEYYREVFLKNNINLDDSIDENFLKLPITTKKDIRKNYSIYFSDTKEEKFGELTSGSTGIPVNCQKTRAERMIAMLNIWKQRRIWDSEVDITNYLSLHDVNTYKKVGNLLNFEKDHMKKCFGRILALSPRWLSGPVSTFEKYAKLIQNGEMSYNKGTIKFLELAGEFADKNRRQYIEEIFGCKTINHYGTIETWCIAYECRMGHLHVQKDLMYAETTNHSILPGEKDIGEITVTSLYNKLMPILRYDIQDLGKVENLDCECGQSSQVITLYGGRTGDMIAGTKEVLGEIFFKRGVYKLINRGMDCIDSFRVEQVELNKFIMYIVKLPNYTDEAERILLDYIHIGIGSEVEVEFKFVEDIPPLPSGKIKIFYSFVKAGEGER